MPKLYEIEGELVRALERVMDAQERGEELPESALTEVGDYMIAAADKRDACRDFLQFVESREAELQFDIRTAQAQLSAITNAKERMENYILSVMQRSGTVAAHGNKWKFVVAPGRDRVEIVDERALISEDSRQLLLAVQDNETNVRIVVEPIKSNIALDLKAGRSVAGARMTKGEPSLQVKPLAARDTPGATKFIEQETVTHG